MIIEPNEAIQMSAEHVLCDERAIHLADGDKISEDDLASVDNAFVRFCQTVDPNRCFIIAHVPYQKDHPTYLIARDVARRCGRHMQADIDTAERHYELWRTYKVSRNLSHNPTDADASSDTN
jgi:hypothetical protein